MSRHTHQWPAATYYWRKCRRAGCTRYRSHDAKGLVYCSAEDQDEERLAGPCTGELPRPKEKP